MFSSYFRSSVCFVEWELSREFIIISNVKYHLNSTWQKYMPNWVVLINFLGEWKYLISPKCRNLCSLDQKRKLFLESNWFGEQFYSLIFLWYHKNIWYRIKWMNNSNYKANTKSRFFIKHSKKGIKINQQESFSMFSKILATTSSLVMVLSTFNSTVFGSFSCTPSIMLSKCWKQE